MNDVILIVAPVFGLIALGFLCAKFRVLPLEMGDVLANFIMTIAIPALLFRQLVLAETPTVSPFSLWAVHLLALALVWVGTALVGRFVLGRPAIDGTVLSMAGSFGNVVMVGLPLCLGAYGQAAATPMAILLAVNTPVLWFASALHYELITRNGGTSWLAIFRDLVVELLKNPMVLGILAGVAWRFTGFGLHPAPDRLLGMLGEAGIPTALFAVGMGLMKFELKGQVPTVSVLIMMKLIALPIVSWVLATYVFPLPPVWRGVAVIFAGTPAGVNAYLLAQKYDLARGSVSAAVALGTVLSVVTLTAVLLVV